MRIAAISDIHGNLPALEAVVRDIERRGVDAVVNLGDSVSGFLLPLETARYLMQRDWIHLAGNHERQLLTYEVERMKQSDAFAHGHLTRSELQWMAGLKSTVRCQPDVLSCHGTPTSDLEYLIETSLPGVFRAATITELDERLGTVDASLVLCGHSHVPRMLRSSAGQLVVNPGSVGLQAYVDEYPHHHIVESGSPDARYALLEKIDQQWVGALIAVPYDHAPMAKLAAGNGRQDWAHALMTGRVKARPN